MMPLIAGRLSGPIESIDVRSLSYCTVVSVSTKRCPLVEVSPNDGKLEVFTREGPYSAPEMQSSQSQLAEDLPNCLNFAFLLDDCQPRWCP